MITVDEAVAVLRKIADHDEQLVPRQGDAVDCILDELDRQAAAITRVRELCAELQVEAVGGGLANADSLWPSDVLEALDRCRPPHQRRDDVAYTITVTLTATIEKGIAHHGLVPDWVRGHQLAWWSRCRPDTGSP